MTIGFKWAITIVHIHLFQLFVKPCISLIIMTIWGAQQTVQTRSYYLQYFLVIDLQKITSERRYLFCNICIHTNTFSGININIYPHTWVLPIPLIDFIGFWTLQIPRVAAIHSCRLLFEKTSSGMDVIRSRLVRLHLINIFPIWLSNSMSPVIYWLARWRTDLKMFGKKKNNV